MVKSWLMGFALLAALACGDSEQLVGPERPDTNVAGAGRATYIVIFRSGAQAEGMAKEVAAAHGGTVKQVYQYALKGAAIELPEAAIAALRRNPNVVRVEADGIVTTNEVPWGLDRLDQRALPLNGVYSYGADAGAGVRVYILDTGLRATHQEFVGRVLPGVNFIPDTNGTNDCRGHGTHVAGTVAGTTYGVAKQALLVPVRVMDCTGTGTYAQLIAGVDWVTANAVKPAVANMSLGGGYHQALNDAVAASVASGVTYVLSAGNNNRDACTQSPAATPTALTVAASTETDARASFSNYGPCVDLFAPGVNVWSAFHTSDDATLDLSGTSMASPHVAGMAARYLGRNPGATAAQVHTALVAAATVGVVTGGQQDTPRLLYDVFGPEPNNPLPPPNAAPYSLFSLYYVEGTLRVAVNPMGYDPDGSLTYLIINWGDGAIISSTAPNTVQYHTYAAPGAYPITVTVRDNVWETASAQKTALVDGVRKSQLPSADFTSACAALVCTFTSMATDPDGTISLYRWDFGDGVVAAGPVVTHTFVAGTYLVRHHAEDNDGGMSWVSRSLTVGEISPPPPPVDSVPVAGLVLVGCSSELICDFQSTSTDDNGIVQYLWNFGDNADTYALGSTARHDYGPAAVVTVTLTVVDAAGQRASASLVVDLAAFLPTPPPVDSPPVAGLTLANCTQGLVCEFRSTSTDDRGIVRYRWNFGDGVVLDGAAIQLHTYAAATNVIVTLTVFDAVGQSSSASLAVNLKKYTRGRK